MFSTGMKISHKNKNEITSRRIHYENSQDLTAHLEIKLFLLFLFLFLLGACGTHIAYMGAPCGTMAWYALFGNPQTLERTFHGVQIHRYTH